MITLLHGDNIERSRAELVRLRDGAKGKEIRTLAGKDVSAQALTQAVESGSLFSAQDGPASGGGDGILVIIENLFSRLGKKLKQAQEFGKILENAPDTDIIIWEDKELGIGIQKVLGPKVKVIPFPLPKLIFQFLDSLRPGSAKSVLTIYRSLVAYEAPELVFAMLVRRVRQLIMVADKVTPEGMQGWQAARLTRQAGLFTMEKLLTMHKALLTIEVSLKTGSSPFTLSHMIEQFLVEL